MWRALVLLLFQLIIHSLLRVGDVVKHTVPPFCLLQVLPVPPRVSGYDAIQPEEVDLWRLQQGLAREREYHQPARRKAGESCLSLR